MKIAALILAAGGSSRLGEPKQLLRDRNGETLIHRTARRSIEAGLSPVVVVVGAERDRVSDAVSDLNAMTVMNGKWVAGMSASIRAGIEYIEALDVDGALLLTADMPTVDADHLTALIQQFEGGAPRVASSYGGTRGIPAIIQRSEFELLKRLSGDRGAKSLLTGDDTAIVPLANGLLDLDTPADVERWRATE